MSFLKRNQLTDWLHSWPMTVVLAVIVVLLATSAYERYVVEKTMRERRASIEAEYQALAARHQQLSDRIEYLTGDRGVEEEIRQQFDVAKPGEQVVILTGAASIPTSTPDTPTVPDVPWYQFWRNW